MSMHYKGRPRQKHIVLAQATIGLNRELLVVLKPAQANKPPMLSLVQRIHVETDVDVMPINRDMLTISPYGLQSFLQALDTEEFDKMLEAITRGQEIEGISNYES